MPSFFITTAIDYTNGAPHIGHAYEKVLADVLARYHRLKGDDVFYLTGVDQHGQKVQQSAEKQGVAPQEFVDGITAKFRALWEKLDVRYDGWAATTDQLHKDCVRANLQMLWDDRDPATGQSRWIYKKSEGGYYSVRQEQFLTDKERGADGEFGPEWQPVEFREEENFYFRLTQDRTTGLPGFDPKQWLLDFIDQRSAAGRPFVIPDFRVAELRNAVEKLEGDLCISRPAARLQWGIPFPESFGAGFVTYVWFDALVNYISFVPGHDPYGGSRSRASQTSAGDIATEGDGRAGAHPSEFLHWWPALHVIGKDIMIPAHGVYWPIMLKALGFTDAEMPTLLVHGWWNIKGKGGESEKMSKSLGNVVDPDVLADKYGAEAVRYYLMSDIATGKDADFSEERLIQRYNTDLANSLGNLLNRTLNMAGKYREGKLSRDRASDDPVFKKIIADQKLGEDEGRMLLPEDWQKASLIGLRLNQTILANIRYEGHYNDAAISAAMVEVWQLVADSNGFVESSAPWKLAKDPAQAEKLDAVLYHLAESLRIIAILLSPVLPKAAHGIFDQLNWKMELSPKASHPEGCAPARATSPGSDASSKEDGERAGARPSEARFRLADAAWGGLPDGHQLGAPTPLFPRIELPKE